MGKIIAAAGHGGPGKSTLIISIGVFLAKKGKSVCWLETDKQGSLQDFVESRKETGITPEFLCSGVLLILQQKLKNWQQI
jgi:chromosome partitioning protein